MKSSNLKSKIYKGFLVMTLGMMSQVANAGSPNLLGEALQKSNLERDVARAVYRENTAAQGRVKYENQKSKHAALKLEIGEELASYSDLDSELGYASSDRAENNDFDSSSAN